MKVDADNEEQNFYDDFTLNAIQKCYYVYQEGSELKTELSLVVFWGISNGSESYILYDDKNNQIIEYSLNPISIWTHSNNLACIVFEGNIYGSLDKSTKMIKCYYNGQELSINPDNLSIDIVPQLKYYVSDACFDFSEDIIKKNNIDNDFYFRNLTNNYGNNVKGSCSFVATGMLLSYINEFVDNNIIPDTFELNYNGNTYNYNKEQFYVKSISSEYNISNFESPGADESFHQFLLDLYNEKIVESNEYRYTTNEGTLVSFLEMYIEEYYSNSSLLGLRRVSDYRYYYLSELEYYQTEWHVNAQSISDIFENSYEWYANQLNRSSLKNEQYEVEYELDMLKEIDNGNPVLIIAGNPLNDDLLELNYEYFNGEKILKNTYFPGAHAMIAYGYVQTENGIYYRCHYGNKMPYSTYNNNDIYIKSNGELHGYVLKHFGEETNVESSSYYYDSGECLINLPTDEIYETYDEFVKKEGNVEFNNTTEYYYCNCETKHLLYQCGHNYHYRKIDDSTHQKYCHCGYNYIENHTIEHTTSTTYDHYAYCIDCSYHDYFIDGITYYVGEDPYNMPEHYHTWSCSLCNLSGVYNHTLEFESLGENYHQMNCKYCDYQDLAPHGCGYNVEIYYNKIADNMHLAYCIGCKEEWIETHIGCNCHL